MLQPLAILCYERVMPGSQLANRLQDLNYRVLVVNDPSLLVATARRESPLLIFVDMVHRGDVVGTISQLKAEADFRHLPVVAFASDKDEELLTMAQQTGARLAVGESALTGHLQQILEQALQLD